MGKFQPVPPAKSTRLRSRKRHQFARSVASGRTTRPSLPRLSPLYDDDDLRDPCLSGLSNAAGVGAARSDLDLVAPSRKTWPGAFEKSRGVFVQIVRAIAEIELVRIDVGDPRMAKRVKFLLEAGRVDMNQVRFHYNPTQRHPGAGTTARSTSSATSTAAANGQSSTGTTTPGAESTPVRLGQLHPAADRGMSSSSAASPRDRAGRGSIDVNGEGTLLTTEPASTNQEPQSVT